MQRLGHRELRILSLGNSKTVGGGGSDREGEMERRAGWKESERRAVFFGFGRNEEDRA